eukprot:3738451-Karenia_brevis.AAC.1
MGEGPGKKAAARAKAEQMTQAAAALRAKQDAQKKQDAEAAADPWGCLRQWNWDQRQCSSKRE